MSSKSDRTIKEQEYQPYDLLFKEIEKKVTANLIIDQTSKKSKSPKKKPITKSRSFLDSESESESQGIQLEFKDGDWESCTDSDLASNIDEDLLAFRTDLDQVEYIIRSGNLFITEIEENEIVIKDKEVIVTEDSLNTLEERFHKELSKGAVLADFHEKYINHVLVQERENEAPMEEHVKREDALRIWRETVSDNPIFALEHISRTFVNLEKASRKPIDFDQIADCKEIFMVDVELSKSSKEFLNFMPLVTPRLDCEEIEAKIKKLSK
jgi:hypothetical protein